MDILSRLSFWLLLSCVICLLVVAIFYNLRIASPKWFRKVLQVLVASVQLEGKFDGFMSAIVIVNGAAEQRRYAKFSVAFRNNVFSLDERYSFKVDVSKFSPDEYNKLLYTLSRAGEGGSVLLSFELAPDADVKSSSQYASAFSEIGYGLTALTEVGDLVVRVELTDFYKEGFRKAQNQVLFVKE